MGIQFRKANRNDVKDIVRLLADDTLGSQRERYEEPLPSQYYSAFEEINTNPSHLLIVGEIDHKVVGTLQLTFTIHLVNQGGKRALIEAVRIDKAFRKRGLGKLMLEWAIAKAREQGCQVVQLTTNKQRTRALEFYKRLGFVPSHEGLKLHLCS